jgi:hypothetical protein
MRTSDELRGACLGAIPCAPLIGIAVEDDLVGDILVGDAAFLLTPAVTCAAPGFASEVTVMAEPVDGSEVCGAFSTALVLVIATFGSQEGASEFWETGAGLGS